MFQSHPKTAAYFLVVKLCERRWLITAPRVGVTVTLPVVPVTPHRDILVHRVFDEHTDCDLVLISLSPPLALHCQAC